MPASGTATVTAKAGPNETVTAQVFSGISSFTVDIARQVLQLFAGPPTSAPVKEFDIAAVTTFTATLAAAAGNWTITVS
jgi:hypothetical protein